MIYFLFTIFIISFNAIQSIQRLEPICFYLNFWAYDEQSNKIVEHRYCSITKDDRGFECITCNITSARYFLRPDCEPRYECFNLNFPFIVTFTNFFSDEYNRNALADIINNKFDVMGVTLNINIGHYFFANITSKYIHDTVDILAPRAVVTLTFDNPATPNVAHVDINDEIDYLRIHALIIIIKCEPKTFPSEAIYQFTRDKSNKTSQLRTNSCTPLQSTTTVSSPKFCFTYSLQMSVIHKINVHIEQ